MKMLATGAILADEVWIGNILPLAPEAKAESITFALPRGMRDVRDLPMITDAMLRRGYSEERVRKFLGGNLLRVFGEITGKGR